MSYAIKDSTGIIKVKLFEQWQGVPIINSTYMFTNKTIDDVFVPQTNGYLLINTTNINQIGEFSMSYTNLMNLPDPTNLDYSLIIYDQETSMIKCK